MVNSLFLLIKRSIVFNNLESRVSVYEVYSFRRGGIEES